MERDLFKENLDLKNTIKDLQLSIQTFLTKQAQLQPLNHFTTQNKEILLNNDKTCHSLIEYSPINTNESLQQETVSFDTQQKSHLLEIPEIQSTKNLSKTQQPIKPTNTVKFDVEDRIESQSNLTDSQVSKDLQIDELKYKKSIDPLTQLQQLKAKTVYNSAIKQKNVCEECITKMHQMHQMEFLKNKYHREYISLRTELQKVKTELNEHEFYQTPRSSINIIEFYGDHTTQQKSQKSQFSFENIQNTLLSERFALEIQQCIKLIDKLLPLDRKFIQLSSGDFKLLMELQMKSEKLKYHLGLDTEPKYLDDLFNELEKSEVMIKKIHEKYKKLLEKICKVHKQKIKRAKDEFNEVNNKFVPILKDLTDQKRKNQKLNAQIVKLKGEIALQQLKEPKTISLSSSHEIKPSSFKQNQKDNFSHETLSFKQKELHDTSSSQCEKTSSLSDVKLQKQLQKMQTKLKNIEKYSKSLQKMIKQQKSQILSMKKKYINDFNQFMNTIIFKQNSKLRNMTQQTDSIQFLEKVQEQSQISEDEIKLISELSTKKLIEEIGTLVYEIFSFTSWQNEDGENIFMPQNETQILQMLKHIKKFANKFDEWQKEKQKQINAFQKNFLQVLKFFIDSYKVSEQKLLEEITKMKDNEPLALYIKRYYSKAVEQSDNEERESSSFTFGQKSQSGKDSEQS